MDNNLIETKINEIINKMTLEQKVGQTIVFCFSGSFLNKLVYRQILDFNCAGLRIHQNPIPVTIHGAVRPAPYILPEQYAAVLNELQDIALSRNPEIPLHFVLDQEGDTSSNYHMGGVQIFPSQTGIVASGKPEFARKIAYAAGKQLRALGVTWIHSPVLDVNSNYGNPEIQERSFGDDAAVCSQYAKEYLQGFKDANIITASKHFPGRGDSCADAHNEMTSLNIPKEVLLSRDLKPYIDNLENIPSIMIAHSAYPALDPSNLPATISKTILTDFLRGELGFKGVITTDNMEMEGIVKLYPIPQACVKAIGAGVDIVLMKCEDEKVCEQTFNGIVQAVKNGEIPLERIEEANRRVLRLKMQYSIFDHPKVDAEKAACPIQDKEIIELKETAIRNGIQVLRNENNLLPLKKDSKIIVIEQSFYKLDQQHTDDFYNGAGKLMTEILKFSRNLTHVLIELRPEEKDIEKIKAKLSDNYDVVVLSSWSRRSTWSFEPIIKMIRDKNLPLVNLINSCYPHAVKTSSDAIVLSFQPRGFGAKALAELLFGITKAAGKWPLKKSFEEMIQI